MLGHTSAGELLGVMLIEIQVLEYVFSHQREFWETEGLGMNVYWLMHSLHDRHRKEGED